jgi:hypothetical protein
MGWASLIGPSPKKCYQSLGTPKLDILFSFGANYIGYKRRTLGNGYGTKCGAIGNTHFKKIKNPIAFIVAKSMTLSFIMIYDPFKNYS